jgi:hypothetical protein
LEKSHDAMPACFVIAVIFLRIAGLRPGLSSFNFTGQRLVFVVVFAVLKTSFLPHHFAFHGGIGIVCTQFIPIPRNDFIYNLR